VPVFPVHFAVRLTRGRYGSGRNSGANARARKNPTQTIIMYVFRPTRASRWWNYTPRELLTCSRVQSKSSTERATIVAVRKFSTR